jgi:hypothetical protein
MMLSFSIAAGYYLFTEEEPESNYQHQNDNTHLTLGWTII